MASPSENIPSLALVLPHHKTSEAVLRLANGLASTVALEVVLCGDGD